MVRHLLHFIITYKFILIDISICYILMVILLINQSNYYKDINFSIVGDINVFGYFVLFLYLYPLDLGENIFNYDYYRSIMLVIIFSFSLLSIIFIFRSIFYDTNFGYLFPYVEKRIINPVSLYVIVLFSYISLMALSYKLIPVNVPLLDKKSTKILDILNVLPLDLVQVSFIGLLFKMKNIIKSKLYQNRVDYCILHDKSNNRARDKIKKQKTLINKQNQIIRYLLYMKIFHKSHK